MPVTLEHECASEVEGLLKHGWLGPAPRASDSAGLGRGLRMCISNKSWGDADAVGPGFPL